MAKASCCEWKTCAGLPADRRVPRPRERSGPLVSAHARGPVPPRRGGGAEGGEAFWIRPKEALEVISAFDAGLDSGGREVFMAYMREIGPAGDLMYRAMQHTPGALVTRNRGNSSPTRCTTSPSSSTSI